MPYQYKNEHYFRHYKMWGDLQIKVKATDVYCYFAKWWIWDRTSLVKLMVHV